MKKIILALAVLSLTCIPANAQMTKTGTQKKTALKQVQVTAQAVTKQPAGKAYMLDLTRAGKIYNLAGGVDYSRVQIHTDKGEMTVAELISKSGKNIPTRGPLRVGMTSDVRTLRLGLNRRPGGLNFSCSNLACVCTGDEDCNDLFSGSNCGPIAVCYPDGCVCIRF